MIIVSIIVVQSRLLLGLPPYLGKKWPAECSDIPCTRDKVEPDVQKDVSRNWEDYWVAAQDLRTLWGLKV